MQAELPVATRVDVGDLIKIQFDYLISVSRLFPLFYLYLSPSLDIFIGMINNVTFYYAIQKYKMWNLEIN